MRAITPQLTSVIWYCRASLQGLGLSHWLSPAGSQMLPHHSVPASCYPARKFLHPQCLTSRYSMHLRLPWDVSSHQARSDFSASAMSQLPLYEPIRTAPTVACLLQASTSMPSILPARTYSSFCSVTFFDDPLRRIRTSQFAHVPILLGNMEDDGSVFTYNTSESISTFLASKSYSQFHSTPSAFFSAILVSNI